MAKKRTAQLDQEIREALSQIPRNPSLKTRAQLDAEIDAILAGGLPAERYEVAQALGFRYPKKAPPKKMTITGTNIFSLAELVLDAGGRTTFPNRMGAPSKPHIKRTIEAGLVELSSPTTLTLTSEGQAAVLHDLRSRYEQSRRSFERSPERYDARARDRLEQMRRAIENLEAA